MSFSKEIDKKTDEQLHSIPAKRLKEKLLPIKSKEPELTKRWFWELLQNASDYNDKVRVKLTFEKDEIIFSHTGAPFSTNDVLNVIAPDSGKDTDEIETKDNIGKFGSGLISTHILSSHLNVRGIVKSEDEDSYYGFNLDLDREKPEDKNFLMQSIKRSRDQFKKENKPEKYLKDTFQTHFTYKLNKPFKGIDSQRVAINGLKYLIDILPYTLSFMRKVLSVEIINNTNQFDLFKKYKISFLSEINDIIKFENIIDEKSTKIELLKLSHQKSSTAVQIKNKKVLPYPENISKLYCGLPLIGTEDIGLPIIINSLDFNPTVERDTINLSPNDKNNRTVLTDGVILYNKLLIRCDKEKFENLFNISYLKTLFHGSEPSKIWFKGTLIPSFKKILLQSKVIKNVKGDNIELSNSKILYSSNFLDRFYHVANVFAPVSLPCEETYKKWSETIDFKLFPNLKYDFEKFLTEITQTKYLEGFVLINNTDRINWLKDILSLLTDINPDLLNKYNLFLNWEGELCAKEDIYYCDDLPNDLIEINNKLNNENIGKTFLNQNFSDFKHYLGNNKVRDLKYLSERIDNSFKKVYIEKEGDPNSFIDPLRKLFNWYNKVDLEKKILREYFSWFSRKRATLFLETFSETERDQALNIAQSGKMEALSKLAESNLSTSQLLELSNKSHLIDKILEMLQNEVDDQKYANEKTGNLGEQLVFTDLKKLFPEYQGYTVIWASKEFNEPRFDFEIKKNSQTIYYIDAKTTIRGTANSDSIPFYLRNKQWDFIKSEEPLNKYIVARVFLNNNNPIIRYIEINNKKLK